MCSRRRLKSRDGGRGRIAAGEGDAAEVCTTMESTFAGEDDEAGWDEKRDGLLCAVHDGIREERRKEDARRRTRETKEEGG